MKQSCLNQRWLIRPWLVTPLAVPLQLELVPLLSEYQLRPAAICFPRPLVITPKRQAQLRLLSDIAPLLRSLALQLAPELVQTSNLVRR